MDPTDHHYEIAAAELEQRRVNRGLFARCIAESGGEGPKAKALYLRLRASQLANENEEREREELEKEELRKTKQRDEEYARAKIAAITEETEQRIARANAWTDFFKRAVIVGGLIMVLLVVILVAAIKSSR